MVTAMISGDPAFPDRANLVPAILRMHGLLRCR